MPNNEKQAKRTILWWWLSAERGGRPFPSPDKTAEAEQKFPDRGVDLGQLPDVSPSSRRSRTAPSSGTYLSTCPRPRRRLRGEAQGG